MPKSADARHHSGYYGDVMPATLVRLSLFWLAVGCVACGAAKPAAPPSNANTDAPTKARGPSLSPKEIVQRSSPAIVRVEAGKDRVGTGFVVDARGIVATNLHVVAGMSEIRVVLYGGASLPVMRIAGVDPERDLALLGVDPAKPLPTLTLGNSDTMSAGDPVIAIGNPLGVLDYSVSGGLLSSVRKVSDKLTVLQISAPISQGSSGGPLFNQSGEVIGVTTAIIAAGQNLNLAVPANYLRPLLRAPQQVSMDEFAAATREADPSGGGQSSGTPKIVRRIPAIDGSAFTGCARPQVIEIIEAIRDAISSGAPVYNQGNHEACFRIYEGTALKFEREAACKGIRGAFGDGLLRAGSVDTFTEKAWAMRDTFDGLLRAAEDWAQQQPGGPVPLP
jgi:serine protease Do